MKWPTFFMNIFYYIKWGLIFQILFMSLFEAKYYIILNVFDISMPFYMEKYISNEMSPSSHDQNGRRCAIHTQSSPELSVLCCAQ